MDCPQSLGLRPRGHRVASCPKLPAADGPDPFRATDGPTPASSVGPGRYRPAPLPCLLRHNRLQGLAPRESDHRNPGSPPWLTGKAQRSFQEDFFFNGTVLKASRVIALCAILSCEGPSCCQYFHKPADHHGWFALGAPRKKSLKRPGRSLSPSVVSRSFSSWSRRKYPFKSAT